MTSTPGSVDLTIFDVRGKRIWKRSIPSLAAGQHAVVWDRRDVQGNQVASGVYFAKLQTGRHVDSGRIVLLAPPSAP